MAGLKVRRLAHLICVAGVALACEATAYAGKNDLQLLNLCAPSASGACPWITRNNNGTITSVVPDIASQSNFRSLMSELGVAVAPRLMTPADTLGYAGFQFSAELGVTTIDRNRDFWNGVQGVDPTNPAAARPDSTLTTVGGFVRKGIWAVELGAGAIDVLGSHMYALQGYAKLALQEGFHDWVLPSLSVRGSASQLLGTDQVNLTVLGVDVVVSKAFSIDGTARIEPFLGWNMLFMIARSGVIDATPGCDAYAQGQAAAGAPPPSSACQAADNGTLNDLNANFTFPSQAVITRQRVLGGFKLKLAALFIAAELDVALRGTSTDNSQSSAISDHSGTQETFSLSGGVDF